MPIQKPKLKLKVIPRIPSSIIAGDGALVTYSGGVWTIAVDPDFIPTLDPELTAIAGLTSAADKGIYYTGSGTAGTYTLTAYGRALAGPATAAAARTLLELGTSALIDTGTSGTKVTLADAANTWALAQTFTAGITANAASTFNVASSNIGAFTVNVQTSSNSVGIVLADNGISKWAVYKDNSHGLNFRDMTNNLDVGGFTQGAGVTSKLSTIGSQVAHSGTAIPAGGTAGAGHMLSSTANFGVFFGSGVPTLSAAKGSLYLRSDGSTTNDRMYVNTNGSTTWTAVTTAA